MAERTLAENVAQVKAGFKAIRDKVVNNKFGYQPLMENCTIKEYAGKVEDAFAGIAEVNYSNGEQFGITEGKQAQYDEFWKSYLNSGKKISLYGAFSGHRWNEDSFEPPYDLNGTNTSNLFANTKIKDLRACLAKHNVKIIFDNNGTQHFNQFSNAEVVYVPVITLPTSSQAYGTFNNCTALKEVDGLVCNAKNAYTNSFLNNTSLEKIIFSGTIANSINLQWSTLLTLESLISLFNCLKNFAEDDPDNVHTKTITLSAESWALLDEYVYENGWNDYMNAQDVIRNTMGWNCA